MNEVLQDSSSLHFYNASYIHPKHRKSRMTTHSLAHSLAHSQSLAETVHQTHRTHCLKWENGKEIPASTKYLYLLLGRRLRRTFSRSRWMLSALPLKVILLIYTSRLRCEPIVYHGLLIMLTTICCYLCHNLQTARSGSFLKKAIPNHITSAVSSWNGLKLSYILS